jgi:AcrR family transcriptional regulator
MVEVSTEGGSAGATVARIVKRAGVSRRTFYEFFADREECFIAALDDGIAHAGRHVLDAYNPTAPWAERIRAALIALLSFLDGNRATGRLLFVDSLGAGAKARARRSAVLAQAISAVEEGSAESNARSDLPALMAEGVVGGVISVLQARLLDADRAPLVELTGQLMGMIVLPYLGPAASRKELARPVPVNISGGVLHASTNPLREIPMRLTYRTVRVLASIATRPGLSNREVGLASEIADQGQISKLLSRLERLDLVRNAGLTAGKGAPNAWTLTAKGLEIERAMSVQRPLGSKR